jgi:hypothetical protein
MPMFVVVLDAQLHGSSVMSTRDVIEADTPEQAEQRAIAAWRALEPRYTYTPLFTRERPRKAR